MNRIIALCCFLVLACGTGSDPIPDASAIRPTTPKTVKVKPDTVTLAPNSQALFTVIPSSLPVTWTVQEAGGGSITAAGLYTAPGAAGTYHVVATSVGVSGTATVTVASSVAITAPATLTTDACVPLQLTATVTGTPNTAVTWALPDDPTCGLISDTGVFTSANVQGTCRAEARAVADPTKTASIMITINEKVLSVAVSPTTVQLAPGGTAQFTATVNTTCNTFTTTNTVATP